MNLRAGLWLLLCLLLAGPAARADDALRLLSEHPVAGIAEGNLSGLTRCGGDWLALSDRDDDRIFRLQTSAWIWRAAALPFAEPDQGPATTQLPFGLRLRAWLAGWVRGGMLDFEGLSCDQAGNRYLISEGRGQVLQLEAATGRSRWLDLPEALGEQARAHGMLAHFNAIYEGLAISPDGQQLWLAAERQNRGLLRLERRDGLWVCVEDCVAETGSPADPGAQTLHGIVWAPDFAGLAWYRGHLYTLERTALKVCQRSLSGTLQQCWSYADTAERPGKTYPRQPFIAEALWIDAQGIWIGLDNNQRPRADGEVRPIIWRFALPERLQEAD